MSTTAAPVQLELMLDLGLGLDFDPEPATDPYVQVLRDATAATAELDARCWACLNCLNSTGACTARRTCCPGCTCRPGAERPCGACQYNHH